MSSLVSFVAMLVSAIGGGFSESGTEQDGSLVAQGPVQVAGAGVQSVQLQCHVQTSNAAFYFRYSTV